VIRGSTYVTLTDQSCNFNLFFLYNYYFLSMSTKLAENYGYNPIMATSFSEFLVLSDEWKEDVKKQKNKKQIIEKIIEKMSRSHFDFFQEIKQLKSLS